jgi:F-type H+-transporting ATPase subunit epsilon
MERRINCNVLTPDGQIFMGDVDYAVIPAFLGSMGFLYNHAPLIAELTTGEVRLVKGNETEYMVVEGGFVEINDNQLSIFPVKAYKKSELFREDIEKEIDRLTELRRELERPVDFTETEKIMKEIKKQKIKLKTANR